MGSKLLIALIALTLFGADFGPMVICAANCMPSAEVSAAVHHQMKSETGRTSVSDHGQARHHDSACAECPLKSGNSLDQKLDCASLIKIEALKNGIVSLEDPSGVAHLGVTETPGFVVGLSPDGERFPVFGASRKIKSLCFTSVPLRI